MVRNYIKKLEEKQVDKTDGTSMLVSISTIAVFTITNDQPVHSINVHNADNNHSPCSSLSDSSDSDDNSETSTTSLDSTSDDDLTYNNIGGHPKGTTASASHDLKCRIEVATKVSVDKLKQLREKMKKEKARLKQNSNIIVAFLAKNHQCRLLNHILSRLLFNWLIWEFQ